MTTTVTTSSPVRWNKKEFNIGIIYNNGIITIDESGYYRGGTSSSTRSCYKRKYKTDCCVWYSDTWIIIIFVSPKRITAAIYTNIGGFNGGEWINLFTFVNGSRKLTTKATCGAPGFRSVFELIEILLEKSIWKPTLAMVFLNWICLIPYTLQRTRLTQQLTAVWIISQLRKCKVQDTIRFWETNKLNSLFHMYWVSHAFHQWHYFLHHL